MAKKDFATQFLDILDEYSKEVQEESQENVIRTAKEAVKQLRATSPKNPNGKYSGRYAKGWKLRTRRGSGWINTVIYNKTDYQLTHLLEKGHRLVRRDGTVYGKVKPKVHIKPVEIAANKKLYNNEIKIVGGKKW